MIKKHIDLQISPQKNLHEILCGGQLISFELIFQIS